MLLVDKGPAIPPIHQTDEEKHADYKYITINNVNHLAELLKNLELFP